MSSSWVARVGYDPDTLTLEVELLDGALYRYFDVPEHEANELVAADSVGTCLNEKIKGRYRYRRG